MEHWNYHTVLPDNFFEGDFHAGNVVLHDSFEDGFDAERMTLGELREFFLHAAEQLDADSPDTEWVQLIPMIAQAIPAIAQGVGSLVKGKGGKRPRGKQYDPQPTPAQPGSVPPGTVPLVAAPPVGGTPTQPTPPTVPPSALSTLMGLLQNPAVLSAVQQIGTNNMNVNKPIGKTDVPVSSVLQVVSQLAGSLAGGAQQEGYPDFLFDNYGNSLADPDSPESVGRLILRQLNR